jgi:altronate dehydratase
MSDVLPFAAAARLPASGDNTAIAIRRLDAGTRVRLEDATEVVLPHTVLEGHRFAIRTLAAGDALLSWGMPFGTALRPIAPGEYVTNQSMLDALAIRRVEGAVFPATANFADRLEPFTLNEATFQPAPPVEPAASPRTFQGYRRPGGRGVGTRNVIVVLGTTSRTAAFARRLTARLQPLARVHPGLDGIVAIAHTEGGGPGEPNNVLEVLRALAGFMVHPNVAAVLAVDFGVEPITNARLREFMTQRGYALDAVPHAFLSLRHGLAAGLAEGERIVRDWLPAAAALRRTPEPISALRVALQCGGSDAFSGVSGNPLAAALVHEVIRHGGSGVMTETDEVIGGEAYLLRRVRDLATAKAVLGCIERFRERLRWHGITPESNPSAGNRFRGLYNIAIKSLGAVHKKDPRVRLDYVTEYAEPLGAPGFYFMNGPGNDLEGIAGQVGAGCNLFLFVTGNGSVTNFPFVPTLKVTTTTRRHQLLSREMDINAGRYLDGETMAALTDEYFTLLLDTAGGRRTQGEHAGHAQVSLWRNWRQTDTSQLATLRARTAPTGEPLPLAPGDDPLAAVFATTRLEVTTAPDGRHGTERVALILPTSLCATQIARLAAERLNNAALPGAPRSVAFLHTEGCGFGGETMYQLLQRTYRGYLTHPNVAAALLLEHGCEKVPNDIMRRQLEQAGIPLDRYGWASVQLDGGIDRAVERIAQWFAAAPGVAAPAATTQAGLEALALGLVTEGTLTAVAAEAFAWVTRRILQAGGSVLLPEGDPLLAQPAFTQRVLGSATPRATLAFGQPISRPGLHVVATETDHWVENVTGLAGCGAHAVLGLAGITAQPGHPLVPVIQFAQGQVTADVDGVLGGSGIADATAMLDRVIATLRGRVTAAATQGVEDFQLTRGLLGVST